jgi:hypothetical protein
MNTSYFAKSSKHPKAVAITIKRPQFYKGRHYPKLAPKPWFLKKYKKDKDENFYIEQYYKEVLNKLNPKKSIKNWEKMQYYYVGKEKINFVIDIL